MSLEQSLMHRSSNTCELCESKSDLSIYEVTGKDEKRLETCILICNTCSHEINSDDTQDNNHWRVLNNTMWSEHLPVQVMIYRIFMKLNQSWSNELMDQMYLEEIDIAWAKSSIRLIEEKSITKDSNGTLLQDGDNVTLIKDLNVKGASFTAKRGTLVKNISLTEDPKFIEGKVNSTQIVLVASYLKKVTD
jgi:protein PhnA